MSFESREKQRRYKRAVKKSKMRAALCGKKPGAAARSSTATSRGRSAASRARIERLTEQLPTVASLGAGGAATSDGRIRPSQMPATPTEVHVPEGSQRDAERDG